MTTPHQIPILSVGQFTALLKSHVEDYFPLVAIRGEVSNVSRTANGHLFLTLKDSKAQLRAVLWRDTARSLKFDLRDGLEIVAVGALDLYPSRGTYQLVIHEVVPQGLGPLELAFRQMKEKLEAEGLFDSERKRPLPRFPRRIALVTSPQGAAVRDIIQVILRRWPAARLVIVPVPVQGEGAAARIARGIRILPDLEGVDVAIVGRGGGSLEDLWPFNEEVVARAIAESPIPIISAVGHEVDVSISDLVADRRALTPSESAEIVVPDAEEVSATLEQLLRRMTRAMENRLESASDRLEALRRRPVLTHPQQQLAPLANRVADLHRRLDRVATARVDRSRDQLATLAATLDALSPLKVLGRGYSITLKAATGQVVTRSTDVQPGDQLETRLTEGVVRSRVESGSTHLAEASDQRKQTVG